VGERDPQGFKLPAMSPLSAWRRHFPHTLAFLAVRGGKACGAPAGEGRQQVVGLLPLGGVGIGV
jgi:hypothetical protein